MPRRRIPSAAASPSLLFPSHPFPDSAAASKRLKTYRKKTRSTQAYLRQCELEQRKQGEESTIQDSPGSNLHDDVNGGSGNEGDEGTRHESPEAHENGNYGGDARREKSPVLGDNGTGNFVERLKLDACIVCDGEDNQVLVCHETGCLMHIHHRCMPEEPDFDELGNFYCPYCWYKRLVVKSLKLQEKVMVADKSVKPRETSDMAVMMDKDGGKTGNVTEVNMSLGRMKSLSRCENIGEGGELGHRCVEIDKNQHKKTVAAEVHEPEVSIDDERAQGQDSDLGEGRKRRRRSSDRRERVEEEKYGDQFRRAEDEDRQCGADVRKDDEIMKELENGLRKDEESKPDLAPSISSPISTNSVNESDQEFILVMRPKGNVQEQPIEARPHHHSAASSKKPLFQPEKFSIGNQSNQEKNATESHDSKQRKDITHGDGKRKRLYWTLQEEQTLRVGVEKFSKTANKNMPWRKILEFGENVFHVERTPADLKDKWKTMNKMS